RRHTRFSRDWSSDVCSSDLEMRARKRRLVEMLRSYRAAATALPDAVVVVDRNTQRMQWFNEAATSLLGLRHPGDMDAPLVERLRSEERRVGKERVAQVRTGR